MRHMVESLSLGSGAILIAVLSAIVVWLLCCFLPRLARSLWIYAVPFALSYSLYWLPVWLGSDSSEYRAWQAVFIIPWFVVGSVSSAITLWIVRKYQRRAESATRPRGTAD
jgi:peptidoglycan/LPS O-acetylase OafA/YrhL